MKKNNSNKISSNKTKFNPKKSFKNSKIYSFLVKTKNKLKIDENRFNILELSLLMIIAFVFGIFMSEAITLKGNNNNVVTNSSSDSNIMKISNVYDKIVSSYYEDINKDKLSDAAIKGMIDYLSDDHSTYFTKEEANSFNERLDGTYNGVGVVIGENNDKSIVVTYVFPTSPAAQAGIKEADIIKKINGESIKGLTTKEIVVKIKGKTNQKISFTLNRNNSEFTIDVITNTIEINSVSSKVITSGNKKIGYIYLSIFALNTYDQFNKELEKLENQNINGLIIDVRNNTGGHLSSVTNILNLFLNKNQVLYQVKSKSGVKKTYGISDINRKYNIVVLTNGYSASASEILASAIKESYGGKTVGTKTYGKGTVQQTLSLDNGSMIKLTTENWLTPNGNLIDKVGVVPDYEVELSDNYSNNQTDENDNQLQKAISVLSK